MLYGLVLVHLSLEYVVKRYTKLWCNWDSPYNSQCKIVVESNKMRRYEVDDGKWFLKRNWWIDNSIHVHDLDYLSRYSRRAHLPHVFNILVMPSYPRWHPAGNNSWHLVENVLIPTATCWWALDLTLAVWNRTARRILGVLLPPSQDTSSSE